MNNIFSADLSLCRNKFKLNEPVAFLENGLGSGVFGYQWTVVRPDGQRGVLSGVSDNPYTRISQYIAEFNRHHVPNRIIEGRPSLHELVLEEQNRVSVDIFGPYRNEGAREVEERLIRSVPERERLNRTGGGNGGSSWSQYDDLPPSQGVFTPVETPTKYYPLRQCADGHITADLTPSAKDIKEGVYCYKKLGKKENIAPENGENEKPENEENEIPNQDEKKPKVCRKLNWGRGSSSSCEAKCEKKEEPDRYVGFTTNVPSRISVHSSLATHEKKSKLHRAISEEPEAWGVGIFPSTVGLSPRSLRRAEIHHVDRLKPSMNSNRGGGGPAPRRTGRGELAPSKKEEDTMEIDSKPVPTRKRKRENPLKVYLS